MNGTASRVTAAPPVPRPPRSLLSVLSGVMRVVIGLAAVVMIVLVFAGSATRTTVLSVSGATSALGVIVGVIRFQLWRYRPFQVLLVSMLLSMCRTAFGSSVSLTIDQFVKIGLTIGFVMLLARGARSNNESGQGARPWIEAGIVIAALDAWFVAALPPVWHEAPATYDRVLQVIVSPATAIIAFTPTILLLARLRAVPGPGLFAAGFALQWASLIANTVSTSSDASDFASRTFLALLVIALAMQGLACLEPSIVTLANGSARWRPQRAWARTAWLLLTPAVVVGAVSISAHSWEGIVWPILLLVSIGLLAVRARLIAETMIARLNRRKSESAGEPPPLDLDALMTWCDSVEMRPGTDLEFAAVALLPVTHLAQAGESGGPAGELDSETVRRIREVMRGAQSIDVGWSGEWAVCQDRERFLVVHVRTVPKAGRPIDPADGTARSVVRLAESFDRWLSLPYRTGDAAVRLDFAIGYAEVGTAREAAGEERRRSQPIDARGLVRDAIWAAQSASSGQPAAFDAGARTALRRRARLAAALDDSLLDGRGLSVVFEPLVDVRTGRAVGAETLARWAPAEWGPVSPGEFIPIAEQSKAMLDLGDWVLNTACRAAAAQPVQRLVAVNVSGVEVAHPDLYRRVMRAADDHQVDPSTVILEITETVISEAIENAAPALRALAAAGIKLSIDDFGTEASGLARLLALPWWSLKLDRSLILRLDSAESASAALIRAVVGLCGDLGAKVVAEGVETPHALRLITDLGCDLAQGWVFGKGRPELGDAWLDQSPPGYRFPGVIPVQM